MQHHFLCNISYIVIAESMGKSLKYTTMLDDVHGVPCTVICYCYSSVCTPCITIPTWFFIFIIAVYFLLSCLRL